ncbi:MAG: hypothetical protein KA379_00720, partial [Oscillospiraceae bacterium]|nr:hypothetical protein [Oscillospiraceae bacterium]
MAAGHPALRGAAGGHRRADDAGAPPVGHRSDLRHRRGADDRGRHTGLAGGGGRRRHQRAGLSVHQAGGGWRHQVRRGAYRDVAQSVNVLNSLFLTDGEHCILTPNYDVFDMYQVHQGAYTLG